MLDLGAGSGLVGIAAAKAGAAHVCAADIDANAIAAITLNAAANDVSIEALHADLLDGLAPSADLVLAGDLFYDEALAQRVVAFLDRCLTAGASVLIGDPERATLPRARLKRLAHYPHYDVGGAAEESGKVNSVFAFQARR